MSGKNEVNFKTFVVFIGATHLGFVGYILYEAILNIKYSQEPFQLQELNYILTHLIFQLFLVITLITGAVKEIYYLMLPWLSTAFMLFFLITLYTVLVLVKEFQQHCPIDTLLNVLYSGILWVIWYIVFSYFLVIKNTRKPSQIDLPEIKMPLV